MATKQKSTTHHRKKCVCLITLVGWLVGWSMPYLCWMEHVRFSLVTLCEILISYFSQVQVLHKRYPFIHSLSCCLFICAGVRAYAVAIWATSFVMFRFVSFSSVSSFSRQTNVFGILNKSVNCSPDYSVYITIHIRVHLFFILFF